MFFVLRYTDDVHLRRMFTHTFCQTLETSLVELAKDQRSDKVLSDITQAPHVKGQWRPTLKPYAKSNQLVCVKRKIIHDFLCSKACFAKASDSKIMEESGAAAGPAGKRICLQ